MSFHVGQKVVCVDDRGVPGFWVGPEYVVAGKIYTVRQTGLRSYIDGAACIRVEETDRGGVDTPFWASRFRPVIERKIDISIFTEMLNTKEQRVPVAVGDQS